MTDLQMHFSLPWLLLLIIPAVLLTLIPYFRLSKRYRRTRNRIISIVLHLVVMVLAITLLCGIKFTYKIPNTSNEIIILVDMSDTEERSQEDRDLFVETVINDSKYDGYNVGVVTFGFDQVYAVPLTSAVETVYDAYLVADKPDVSATNIADALEYVATLFTNPVASKVVLVTDGLETDEKASQSIRYLMSQGTKLDIAYITDSYSEQDIQTVDVVFPDYQVVLKDTCSIELTVNSTTDANCTITMLDNGAKLSEEDELNVKLSAGTQSIVFKHAFETEGLHKIDFNVQIDDDIKENNIYSTFYYLELFDKILLVTRDDITKSEADLISDLLVEKEFKVDLKCFLDDEFPFTVNQLREYDQVILNNIANDDMPEGFIEELNSYVQDYGGALLTIGGNEYNDEETAHAYNRVDMYGTLYQDMLPVQTVNYTPPIGLMVIIDRSGSMSSDIDGYTKLEWARIGASRCLASLTERDYFGLMTLDSEYQLVLPMTPVTKENVIKNAISKVNTIGGSTQFSTAIDRAGQQLRSLQNVSKRHIIIITDGQPTEKQADYEGLIEKYQKQDGITLSVVVIGETKPSASSTEQALINGTLDYTADDGIDASSPYLKMLRAVWIGNDTTAIPNDSEGTAKKRQNVINKVHFINSGAELIEELRRDLEAPDIVEKGKEVFYPTIKNLLSPVVNGVETGEGEDSTKIMTSLLGFYGTKAKMNAEVLLTGNYEVPIYAQWSYGKGKVGSFMIDFQGIMSRYFMEDESCRKFIINAINNLMTNENIRATDITINELKEDNYTNTMSIITDIEEGQRLEGTVSINNGTETIVISLNEATEEVNSDFYVTNYLDSSNNFSRCGFIAKYSGVYTITLKKVDEDGNVLSTLEKYKYFAYSKEYDRANQPTYEQVKEDLVALASRTEGAVIEDLANPKEIFKTFIVAINKTYDPRTVISIIIIVLVLLDIAVRKFKFKWIHEIIQEHKNKNKA